VLPNTSMYFATGNNLTVLDDMTRRVIVGSLDPKCERPELLEFEARPLDIVRADRGRYVVAALTIVRDFNSAGAPQQATSVGSYEAWSTMLRDALLWLDEADPIDTMEKLRGADRVLASIRAATAGWEAAVGFDRCRVRDAITAAMKRERNDAWKGEEDLMHPDFHDALFAVARSNGGEINPERLGRWLKKHGNRIVGNRRFVEDGSAGGAAIWRLEGVEEPRQRSTR
jgi:putative DNA primase/helicase